MPSSLWLRHAQTKMPGRTGFLYTALIYIRELYIFPVWLFFCGVCRPGRQKHHGRNGQQCRIIFNFQANIWIIAVYIISIGYAVHGFCGYFKENPPHDRFPFTHKHTTRFRIHAPLKPNDHYLKRRCMKKKKQAESERGDFHK